MTENISAREELAKRYAAPYWDFDEIIDRRGTNSVKYGNCKRFNEYLGDTYLPMWVADMDFACPQPILDAMHERIDRRILGYTMLDEGDEYYDIVCQWERQRHGIHPTPDMIVYSAGVVRGIAETVCRLTAPEDKVLINTPGYHPFESSVTGHGRELVCSELINDGNGYYTYDWEDMEKKAADPAVKLFLLCSPHNPTGRVWTEEELRRIGDIMFRNNVFVFVDEIWHDHIRTNVGHVSFMKLFPDRKDYIIGTAPSKTFNIAGNDLANLIIPDTAIAAEWRRREYTGSPGPLAIAACKGAYLYCAPWVDAMCAYMDANFALVDETVKTRLKRARFTPAEGTYVAWLDLSGYGLSDEELKKRISAAGLFIQFSKSFVGAKPGFARINIAAPRSVVQKGMDILVSVLENG